MTGSEQDDCACEIPRAERIARLNDELRKTGKGGTVCITHGVRTLLGSELEKVGHALANYDAFDADNDPHGERDFGDIEVLGASLFWKVDYYDKRFEFLSPDPADEAVTKRVLTIMLTREY